MLGTSEISYSTNFSGYLNSTPTISSLGITNHDVFVLNSSFGGMNMSTTKESVKGFVIVDTNLRRASRYMDFYFVPCVIALGLIGNTLSFLVFVLTNLKRLSSSVYLAALSISDSGFLICVFFSWSNNINITIYHKPGWCQAFVYMTYIFGFLSVWYIVAFSCERFIAVRWPFKRSAICTPRKARIVVVSLAIFALVAYSFALWTSEVAPWYGMFMCFPKEKYRNLVGKLNNIDTIVTLVVPFITILFCNSWIVFSVRSFSSHKQQQLWQFQNGRSLTDKMEKKMASRTQSVSSNLSSLTLPTAPPHQRLASSLSGHSVSSVGSQRTNLIRTSSAACSSQRRSNGNQRHLCDSRRQSQLHVTKMLLVVSSIFLLFNLPCHVIRLYDFFQRLINKSYLTSLPIIRLQKIFTYVYYVNFSINFLLYNLCGKNFRRALKILITKAKQKTINSCRSNHSRKPTIKSIRSAKSLIITNV